MKQIEHAFIPDTQVKPGVPTDHIEACGNYLASRMPDKIIFAGDWWDMYSLNSYDLGKKAHEGARYEDDITSGYEAMVRFFKPIKKVNVNRRRAHLALWKPEFHFIMGNHEYRINRHVETYPVLDGKLSLDDLRLKEFDMKVYPFLEVARIDEISYSHYFPRGPTGAILQTRRAAPSAWAQVTREMRSCTSGHTPGLDIHVQTTGDGPRIGLKAGSFYMHQEDYQSPQGQNYWKGIVYKHRVKNGAYDPCFVSMEYLLEEWL